MSTTICTTQSAIIPFSSRVPLGEVMHPKIALPTAYPGHLASLLS
jgi:hypothetical protein